MTTPDVSALIEQGIAAFKAGDRDRAYALLTEALQAEPRNEAGWLWMWGVVQEPAKRRYCLERVVEINPKHEAAQRGLSKLPADLVAHSPLPTPPPAPKPPQPDLARCTYPGCTKTVARLGHKLCFEHWRPPPKPLATENGEQTFRKRFPAEYRTNDGHMVRSKAEMLIDNWLYVSGVVHAYERRLPIEEEVYCDFYLPAGKVYIEYWGLENDAAYNARKKVKIEIYQRHGLQLIELTDEHIRNLDDHLPKMLLKYEITVE